MTIPEVKLIVLAAQAATPIDAPRSRTQPAKPTLADLRWMRVEEFLRSREIRPNTHKAYERDLKQLIDWTPKGWHEITSRDLDRYKNFLKTEPNHRGKLRKSATINRSLAALQSFFKWLTVRDYITKNPALLLEKLKSDPVLPQEFSQNEVDNLYQAICDRGFHSCRDRALLHLIDHGLRASEIQGLNVGDYDGQRIHIREAKADSVGSVPLLSKARRAIDQYKQWREQQGEVLEDESPLFVSHSNNSKGERLKYWGIYKIFKAIADIAEVENAHPHRGRHTLATRLVMKDMDSILARKVTRHKSEQSFVRYSDRGIELKAEQEFYEVHGESPGGEDGIVEEKSESVELKAVVKEPANWPKITAVDMPLNAVQVGLTLEVSGKKKGTVRKEIEERVLSQYQMVKPKPRGNEYELTVVVEEGDALSAITDQMKWDMELLGELDDCEVKVAWLDKQESTGELAQEFLEDEPTFAETSAGQRSTSTTSVYQLKITLLGVRPQVWRRIQVPETTTLAQLHSVLQVVMGWEGYHLHQFLDSEDEAMTLAELIEDDLFSFGYLYDFGDMWQHEIKVEKRLESKPGKNYPICLAGKRACPPEDCGGDWGYAHLLEVMKNPRHPQYEERMEWVGSEFDPKAFDIEEVNQVLRELEVETADYNN